MEDHHNGGNGDINSRGDLQFCPTRNHVSLYLLLFVVSTCPTNQHQQHLTIFSLQCIHVHARTYARPAQHELILPEALTRMHETSTCPNPPVQSDTARGIHVPFFGILQRKRVTLHSVVLFVPAV